MIILVTGFPGGFAEWCEVLSAELICRALGPVELNTADTPGEVFVNMLRRGASHRVVASRQPGGGLRRALVEARRPFIVALDDPRAAMADLVVRRGVAIATATRMVASSCASSMCFSAAPSALVLRADRDGSALLSTAAAIARHLEIDLSLGEIAEIVSRVGPGPVALDPSEVVAWWKGLALGEQSLAEGAIGPYLDGSAAGEAGQITWASELFFVGDRPAEPVTGNIDITGRARCLLRGPQILLPPGHWFASVTLHVSPEAAEHRFLLEVAAGAALSRTNIHPGSDGTIGGELTLMLEELPDRPIELTLSNERPAFAGQLSLLHVTLTRQPPALAAAASERNEPRTAE